MNYLFYIGAIVLIPVLAMNLVATIRLLREKSFTALQKGGQLAFLWLVPVIGFAFVWHFLNEVAPPRVTTDLRTWLESDDTALRSAMNEPSQSNAEFFGHQSD